MMVVIRVVSLEEKQIFSISFTKGHLFSQRNGNRHDYRQYHKPPQTVAGRDQFSRPHVPPCAFVCCRPPHPREAADNKLDAERTTTTKPFTSLRTCPEDIASSSRLHHVAGSHPRMLLTTSAINPSSSACASISGSNQHTKVTSKPSLTSPIWTALSIG